MEHRDHDEVAEAAASERRAFLRQCGRFAVLTPPAITTLLSTTLSSDAIASSGGSVSRGKGDKTPPGLGGSVPPGHGGTAPGQAKKG